MEYIFKNGERIKVWLLKDGCEVLVGYVIVSYSEVIVKIEKMSTYIHLFINTNDYAMAMYGDIVTIEDNNGSVIERIDLK